VVSAHGRVTGFVLTILPFAIAAVLYMVSPQHIERLFTDPAGQQMVAIAGVLQIIGLLIIRRIVTIEV
jgi:tight adherence protein B